MLNKDSLSSLGLVNHPKSYFSEIKSKIKSKPLNSIQSVYSSIKPKTKKVLR